MRQLLIILGSAFVSYSAIQIWGYWSFGIIFGVIMVGYASTYER